MSKFSNSGVLLHKLFQIINEGSPPRFAFTVRAVILDKFLKRRSSPSPCITPLLAA